MQLGCNLDATYMQSRCNLDPIWIRVGPRQNNDSRESEMDSREKIGIAKIIHKIA